MDIDHLLKTVYEIEAVLKLIREGGDDQVKTEMLKELAKSLADRLDDAVGLSDTAIAPADQCCESVEADGVEMSADAEFEQEADADMKKEDEDIVIVVEESPAESSDDREDSTPDAPDKVKLATEISTGADLNSTALRRRASVSLANAFTLNDKFRFRRELFGNSEVAFAEALATVEAMKSREEAEEYFYGSLSWDPENDDVADFMRIITSIFTD